ncbi:hypothetical protein KPL37_17840 [Clostridium frigoris]|uniref:Uncharacterized protein n=1 Tax=Clostridium frigoris TaxID=205327 RepID=A0ABS6BY90_9CLOT|nr:hypothetical protein [Clostridium frigoris]MBU3161572.1 hypothetical protein [Clostridium frigoris]
MIKKLLVVLSLFVILLHSTFVSEVYILIPENEPPCYLIFEDENKLLSLRFNGDIDKLSKILNFKLNKN